MKQGKTTRRPRLRKFLIAALVFSLVFAIPGVSVFATNYLEDAGLGKNGKYFNPYNSLSEAQAAANALHEEIASEGIVLLKNQGSLPMAGSKRVTGFNVPTALQTVLNNNGFTVNSSSTSAVLAATANYTAAQLNSFKSYNDAAIVYIARGGGEGADLSVGNDNQSSMGSPTTANGSGFDNGFGAKTGYNGYGPMLYDDQGNETWPDGTPYGWNHDALAPANAQKLIAVAATQNTAPVRHELMLTLSEERMIQIVEEQGFKEIIVVVNTSHPMELYNLDRNPSIGAILWVGRQISGGSTYGQTALAKILNGVYNPSGRTIDEWYRDFTADPTWQNFGYNSQTDTDSLYRYPDGTITGLHTSSFAGSAGVHGLDYEESIYLGYKYYETYWAESKAGNTSVDAADADQWWEDNVVYPLGYGLSYTEFSYEMQGVYTERSLKNNISGKVFDGAIFASEAGSPAQVKTLYIPVTVQNLRGRTGKTVVEIYVTAPYISNGIEKSFVTLCGYTKTRAIENGFKQTVVVEVNVQDFASFDYNDANSNGNTGWELDPGEYVVRVMNTSHVNTAAADYDERTFGLTADVNLKLDDFSGNVNEPLFSDPDSRTYMIRDNSGTYKVNNNAADAMTLLSRADMEGTFPVAPTYGDLTVTEQFLDEVIRDSVGFQAGGNRARSATGLTQVGGVEQGPNYDYKDDPTDAWYKTPEELDVLMAGWTQSNTTGTARTKSTNPADWLDSMAGVPLYEYDTAGNPVVDTVTGMTNINPLWTSFVNKLNYDELKFLVSQGSFNTAAITYIGKRVTRDQDSPINMGNTHAWGDCNIITATYNVELGYKQGEISAFLGMYQSTLSTGIYGPGVNIHRSPFSGRNAEYYGQDGFQSGIMAAAIVRGCEENGMNCYIKHTFMNDQESYRCTVGVCTWASEQAMRECYGVTTQKAMQEGKASATMTAFNRIGAWATAGCYEFMTGLFREQWGWTGIAVTDMYSSARIGAWTATATPQFKYDAHFVDGVATVTAYNQTKNWSGTAPSLSENTGNVNLWNYSVDLMVRAGCETPLGNQGLTSVNSASGSWSATMNGDKGGVYLKADGGKATDADMTVSARHQYYYVRSCVTRILYFALNSYGQMNGFFANNTLINPDDSVAWVNTTAARQQITGLTQGVAMTNVSAAIPAATLKGSTATYSVTSGTLPAGITLNASTGAISGTPSARTTAAADFTVTAKIDGWISMVRYFSIAAITGSFTNTPAATASVSLAYSSSAAVSDEVSNAGSGTRSYTIASGALPAGLSIASATGVISGTPTTAGTYNFTVQYQRGTGNLAVSQQFTIAVSQFKVTFDNNYAGAQDVVVAVGADGRVSPVAGYRPGNVFLGWFKEDGCINLVDFDEVITADTTYYAGWVLPNDISIKIGFNGNWWVNNVDTGVRAAGIDGQNGVDGKDGVNGVTPNIGYNGNWWLGNTDTGVKAIGTDGQDGQNGQDGVSPFIGGNGNWWLGSVDTGVKAIGTDGQNGQDGQDGQDGVTPNIGYNGNWWIGNVDTGVKAIGTDGQNGQDGTDGVTPNVGANGNWWIGNVDTGVKAQGAKGDTGDTGAKGDKGDTGEIGAIGPAGSGCGSSSASIIALFGLLVCAFAVIIKKQF